MMTWLRQDARETYLLLKVPIYVRYGVETPPLLVCDVHRLCFVFAYLAYVAGTESRSALLQVVLDVSE